MLPRMEADRRRPTVPRRGRSAPRPPPGLGVNAGPLPVSCWSGARMRPLAMSSTPCQKTSTPARKTSSDSGTRSLPKPPMKAPATAGAPITRTIRRSTRPSLRWRNAPDIALSPLTRMLVPPAMGAPIPMSSMAGSRIVPSGQAHEPTEHADPEGHRRQDQRLVDQEVRRQPELSERRRHDAGSRRADRTRSSADRISGYLVRARGEVAIAGAVERRGGPPDRLPGKDALKGRLVLGGRLGRRPGAASLLRQRQHAEVDAEDVHDARLRPRAALYVRWDLARLRRSGSRLNSSRARSYTGSASLPDRLVDAARIGSDEACISGGTPGP